MISARTDGPWLNGARPAPHEAGEGCFPGRRRGGRHAVHAQSPRGIEHCAELGRSAV